MTLQRRTPSFLRLWSGVALLGLLCIAQPPLRNAAAANATLQVRVTGCDPAARVVPANYLGLSVEWGMVPRWFGPSRSAVALPMVGLLRSLQTGSVSAGVLRIGGNSQDRFRWHPGGSTVANTPFEGAINTGMVDALLEVARRTGWRLILGLNLRTGRPFDAASMAHYVVRHDTTHRVLAFELGNEPNGYVNDTPYRYRIRVQPYLLALRADPVTRHVPIAGPALGNSASTAYVSALRQAYGMPLPLVTWHHYGNQPTVDALLDESVDTRWTDRMAEVGKAAGLTPNRMDEGNSVGLGGLHRVSDVTASSTWLADALLTGAEAGLSGFNVHSWDGYGFPFTGYYPRSGQTSYYTPFVFRAGLVVPRPLVYALALLRSLGGQRFCQTITTGSADAHVKAWALRNPTSGHLSVFVVNKRSGAGRALVDVVPPDGYSGVAAVSRLHDTGGCSGAHPSINSSRLPGNGSYRWQPERLVADTATSIIALPPMGPCDSALLDVAAS
ncbi:MAG: glycosyl hydrolase family 79 C-terminal domain-containing protein [Mycobacteriales bacterium]